MVGSETATVLMLPAYKIIEMSKDNTALAARLWKKTAATLQTQVERILRRTREIAADLTAFQGIAEESVEPTQRARAFSAESVPSSSSTSPPASPAPLKATLSSPHLFA
jgi:hypothetical protein